MLNLQKKETQLKGRLVKDTVKYSTGTLISQVVTLFRSIIVARCLGPMNYGLWNALSLIFEYSRYSDLGISNAINREIPFYKGKNDLEKVNELKNVGFWMSCIPALVIAVGLLIFSFAAADRYQRLVIIGFRAISILVVLQQIYLYYQVLLRSHNEFGFLSKLLVMFSIIDLALIAVLVTRFNFVGLLWALILTYTVTLVIILRHRILRCSLWFRAKTIASLMKIGLPIILIAILSTLFVTTERFIIIRFLDLTSLGYYGLALLISRILLLIPDAVSTTLYPRLNEKYGVSNKDISSLKEYIVTPAVILSYAMPIVLGVAYLVLPLGVKILLPNYISGIKVAQIVLLGIFFSCISANPANFLVTTNKMMHLVYILSASLILRFLVGIVFVRSGMGLRGVAIGGPIVVTFIYSTFVIGYVAFNYFKSVFTLFKFFAKIYFPFVYCVPVIFIIEFATKDLRGGLSAEITFLFFKLLIFMTACIPLLWYMEKETAILTQVRSVIRDRFFYKNIQ